MTTRQYICIGSFEQNTGTIIVSDPTYEPTTKYFFGIAAQIPNVQTGTYYAVIEIIKEQKRNSALFIFHEDFFPAKKGPISSKVLNEIVGQLTYKTNAKQSIGVDAGMAGFYDKKFYFSQHTVEWSEFITDKLIQSPKRSLILPSGVISDSGYGDGFYTYYIAKANNKVVSVCLSFIDAEDN
jgi:hypothetical protein